VTQKYDDRTDIYFKESRDDDGKEVIVIEKDEYDRLASMYKTMHKKVFRYSVIHQVAYDVTSLLIIVRLLLACLLGLLLPMLFSPGVDKAFIIFYTMLLLALVLSLFIPGGTVPASELFDKMIYRKK
jgi:hypothetical protein